MAPNWVDHAIWWQIYPLGFTGAPIRTEHDIAHRFPHMESWLDYAVELGASGVLLGPIFTSTTHGYDTTDLLTIDPRLGTEADFDSFITECDKRGLRVVLDGVFNHVGSEHPWVHDIIQRGSDSPYSDLISWRDGEEGIEFDTFEGHETLVALNHQNPKTAEVVEEAMRFWLDRGASGWRLDAAYAVPEEFWARVLPEVRKAHPDAWFVGEVIHGDYDKIARESTLDSLTQYELWKAIWSSQLDENFFELAASLERNNRFLDAELPLTFVGNHDVTRITSLVGHEGAVLALTVLMTVGGTPSLYYGDEQGYGGLKEDRLGGDDDVRPLFPDTPAELGPFGEQIHEIHKQLIAIRRRNAWLWRARTETVDLSNKTFTYRSVSVDNKESLLVTLDLSTGHAARVQSSTGEVLFSYFVPN